MVGLCRHWFDEPEAEGLVLRLVSCERDGKHLGLHGWL